MNSQRIWGECRSVDCQRRLWYLDASENVAHDDVKRDGEHDAAVVVWVKATAFHKSLVKIVSTNNDC